MKMDRIWLQAALGVAMSVAVAGCHSKAVDAQSGPDPAAANLAQPGAENESQQQAAQYNGQQPQYDNGPPPAPIERAYPNAQQGAPPQGYYDNGQQPYGGDQAYNQGDDYAPVDYDSLTDEQATEPPPPLPDYDQPPAPDPDYLWTPGYWAWGPEGYYWVPGCWVEAPYVGALWTPGYWGYAGNVYRFHHGYWGRHIGFYGGINYGFGYIGVGYEGGYWNGSHFYYNSAVTRVNLNVVRNVYAHSVAVDRGPRVSFDGGHGGLQARPRPAEIAAIHEQRYAPTQSQVQVRDQASQNRQQFYSSNHGRPAETVAARPVASDHRMPAELPRAAAVPVRSGAAAQMNPGNRPAETARPGQFQQGAPQNVPRGGAAPETARPGAAQQNGPGFQQRPQAVRSVQPQNEVRPQMPAQQPARPMQPQGERPQFDNRAQPHPAPQQFHQQAQPTRQAPPPQAQHTAPQQPVRAMPENRPAQPPMRQGPPAQAARPQAHQAPAPQTHAPPPPAHAKPHPEQHGGGQDEHHQ